ncbi:hypothetical protein YpB42003004_0560 [Yersinia pestis biovar Antiqua str. B42003004]|nr:hypothetical protein YpE1979001_3218 [Yersinia pestis biovar Antiqua str. E1979001]EDR49116.1 hypothetical protein YpB42003004_0560 [Yersinia pestis biovar Antiqua str. B42003004]EDR65311.1 hypothetical protein YpK1973002_3100 [Yersinia pestis biovar Mediaevalis str. K1973002]EIQ84697.1 hypothetical protein YPPY03_4214 [Yersinia pestis PY-03]EIQ98809.1 hypothetical protein YPPY05_4128 [Yersinia pestis PY-05]EIR15325.1 hypothetical protein YPPY09_4192 [Yersinia pestis PY-09]EIR28192.1 hypot
MWVISLFILLTDYITVGYFLIKPMAIGGREDVAVNRYR